MVAVIELGLFAESLNFDPTLRLKVLISLAEMCIDVLQQNKEYHYEVTIVQQTLRLANH